MRAVPPDSDISNACRVESPPIEVRDLPPTRRLVLALVAVAAVVPAVAASGMSLPLPSSLLAVAASLVPAQPSENEKGPSVTFAGGPRGLAITLTPGERRAAVEQRAILKASAALPPRPVPFAAAAVLKAKPVLPAPKPRLVAIAPTVPVEAKPPPPPVAPRAAAAPKPAQRAAAPRTVGTLKTAARTAKVAARPSASDEAPGQAKTTEPPDQAGTSEAPRQAKTEEPPGQVKTTEPPGQVEEPVSSDPGKTEPPGQVKTEEPPGQVKTDEPPGQVKTEEPPGRTETPPGQASSNEPPGQGREEKPK